MSQPQPKKSAVSTTTDTLTQLIDQWYELDQSRLEHQREADALADEAKDVKAKFTSLMKEHKITGFDATLCTVSIKEGEPAPTVRSWELFYKYVMENNAFALLQKRVSVTAIREHWEAGEHIPGVDKFPVDKLTVASKKS